MSRAGSMPERSGEEEERLSGGDVLLVVVVEEEDEEEEEEEEEDDEDDFLAAALDEALEPRPAVGAAVSDLQISAVVRFLLWS